MTSTLRRSGGLMVLGILGWAGQRMDGESPIGMDCQWQFGHRGGGPKRRA